MFSLFFSYHPGTPVEFESSTGYEFEIVVELFHLLPKLRVGTAPLIADKLVGKLPAKVQAVAPEFLSALEDAGINEVIAAKQEQFDNWLSENQ